MCSCACVCTICRKQIVFLFGFLIIFINFSFWFAFCSRGLERYSIQLRFVRLYMEEYYGVWCIG